MRSVTSSFNRAIYQKNMLRFWPIWVVYSIILAFMLPLQILIQRGYEGSTIQASVTSQLWSMARYNEGVIFCFLLGIIAAMAVYGYLYTSRSACTMHSLPIKRQSLFLTNYLSGLSMVLIPNVIIAILTISAGVCRGVFLPVPVLLWLLLWSVCFIFFFSFATFCAMLTGSILALPTFYVIFNFLAAGLMFIITPVMEYFLYGFFSIEGVALSAIEWLTPTIMLSYVHLVTFVNGIPTILYQEFTTLAIYFVAAIVFTLLALMLYLRHATESAGDIVSTKLLRPIFRYSVGFCGGLSLGLFTTAILHFYDMALPLIAFTLLWGIVSYFVAEMLLQKSFRVLNAWKGAVILCVIIGAFFVSISFDVYGFEKAVPASDQVSSIRINFRAKHDGRSHSATVSDIDTINQILALHQAIVTTGPESLVTSEVDYLNRVHLNYMNEDGSTLLSRFYQTIPVYEEDLETLSSVTWAANQLFTDQMFKASVFNLNPAEDARIDNISITPMWNTTGIDDTLMTTTDVYVDDANLSKVFDAIQKDFAAGNLGQIPLFASQPENYTPYRTSIYIDLSTPRNSSDSYDYLSYDMEYSNTIYTKSETRSYHSSEFALTAEAVNTLAVLNEIGIIHDQQSPVTYAEYADFYYHD